MPGAVESGRGERCLSTREPKKNLVLGLATLREAGGQGALAAERSCRLGALAAEAAGGGRAGGLGPAGEGLEARGGALLPLLALGVVAGAELAEGTGRLGAGLATSKAATEATSGLGAAGLAASETTGAAGGLRSGLAAAKASAKASGRLGTRGAAGAAAEGAGGLGIVRAAEAAELATLDGSAGTVMWC